jgi:pSer/pThr/pTyr-binding forkhead associated (FHA) protein
MAKIIYRFENKVINEYPIKSLGKLTVGRKADNDIYLDDETVSSNHASFSIEPSALVTKKANDVYIEDSGSTNGTELGGRKIKREQLMHGDIVKIGEHAFYYIDEEQQKLGQTVVINPEDIPK